MQLKEMPDKMTSGARQVGLLAYSPHRPGPYGRYFKRPLDVLAVLIGSIIVVPVVIVLALVVMTDGGNPFYTSDRVGRGGRTFRMVKLRTMVHDAERRLEGYLAQNPEARIEWDQTQKLKYDPRVTMLGRFLRKSSLDELPQLWNVLTGDMSLVGPRPMMPEQREIYAGQAYYALRPGLTGLWQISDRNNCTFAKRAEFDTEYERCLSFRTDLVVLFRTVGAVAHGTGY
mgnify:FL=1